MMVLFWFILTMFFALSLLVARRVAGIELREIFVRWQDVAMFSMIFGLLVTLGLQMSII